MTCYEVRTDGSDFDRYLRGEPGPDMARKQPWMDRLAADAARGLRNYRVHVVRSPLSPYLRYECEWGYAYNVTAGEEIRILDLAEHLRPLALIDEDFWLMDDASVVKMHYRDWRFIGAYVPPTAVLPRYRAARDAAGRQPSPSSEYWAAHPRVLARPARNCRTVRRGVPPQGPDWLSRTLRELREKTGLSGSQAARQVGISQSRISRIEAGRFLPTEEEITTLADLYRVPATIRRRLLKVAKDLRAEETPARVVLQRGAWRLQRRIASIEENADEISGFSGHIVPGLLQTPDYARAVFADGGDISPQRTRTGQSPNGSHAPPSWRRATDHHHDHGRGRPALACRKPADHGRAAGAARPTGGRRASERGRHPVDAARRNLPAPRLHHV